MKVWAALVLLTGVTVGAAYADLKHLAVLVAVLVASREVHPGAPVLHAPPRTSAGSFAGMFLAGTVLRSTFVDRSVMPHLRRLRRFRPQSAAVVTLATQDIVEKVDEAFYWIGGISLFFFVGITARRSSSSWSATAGPATRTAAPIHGNTALEITWIVIPTLIVLFMFCKGYEGFRVDAGRAGRGPGDGGRGPAVGLDLPLPGDRRRHLRAPRPHRPPDPAPAHRPRRRRGPLLLPPRLPGQGGLRPGAHEPPVVPGRPRGRLRHLLRGVLRPGPRADDLPPPRPPGGGVRDVAGPARSPSDTTRSSSTKALDPASAEIQARDAPALYATYCASCHGAGGEGGLVEGARDFRRLEGWKRGPALADVVRTLTEGLAGTQMRAFPNLPPWDRFALAHHVASFHRGACAPPGEHPRGSWPQLMKDHKFDEPPTVAPPPSRSRRRCAGWSRRPRRRAAAPRR